MKKILLMSSILTALWATPIAAAPAGSGAAEKKPTVGRADRCTDCDGALGAVLIGFGVVGGAFIWDSGAWSDGVIHLEGLEIRLSYERPHYRINGDIHWYMPVERQDYFQGGASASFSWLFLDESWSPYIGAGLGLSVLNLGWNHDAGGLLDVHAGLELMRNRSGRLLLEFAGSVPFFNVESERSEGLIQFYGVSVRGGVVVLF